MRKSYSTIPAAFGLTLSLAVPAGAADYAMPVIAHAPHHVPVEVGSGWYLRGDLSYNADRSHYDFSLLGQEADNTRFGGSIGVGYHFNDLLRGDVNISHVARDSFDFDDGTDSASLNNRVLGLMANAYLDLGTFVGFTPYVGAGAGVLHARQRGFVDAPSEGLDFTFSDRQYAFAYALNAGVAYRVSDSLSVDVGYQYLKAPRLEYVDTNSGTVERGVDYHQIRVGLRYDLW